MPHTNNAYASDRKASRQKKKPAFLTKRKKSDPATPNVPLDPSTMPKDRAEKTALIREFHALEKQLKSGATTEEEKVKIRQRQEELGGLQTYQEASVHGGDKVRGGESSKWLVKQLKHFKVALDQDSNGKGKEKEKVEPKILEDGTKVWPKPKERRKLKLLDVGAIAGTAYASQPWIDTTSIDLNPQAPHVIKSNFFDFPIPDAENDDDLFDVVSLSLVMNFEGSLVNRGHFLLRAHDYLKRKSPGYLYVVLPLPCLTNSRYLDENRFRSILKSTNWEPIAQHDSPKLTYWFLRETVKEGDKRKGDGTIWKREECVGGVKRNNFCITVKPDEAIERGVEAEKEGEVTGEVEVVAEDDGVTGSGKKANAKKRKLAEAAAELEKKEKPQSKGQGKGQAKNNKRKAESTDEVEAPVQGNGDAEGGEKKKAKKSKPVKGKKIVFDDNA